MKYLAPELDITRLVDHDVIMASIPVHDEGNLDEVDWNDLK